MYTLETLKEINGRFCCSHYLENSDVEMANDYVDYIERNRSTVTPQTGDRIKLYNKYGDYYSNAHLDRVRDGAAAVCESPYVPFIWKSDKGQIGCSCSGGAWLSVPLEKLKYIGKEKKTFCDWGNCGACADGAVEFQAWVSVWEYVEEGHLYNGLSTKDYRKEYISYRADEFGKPIDGSRYVYFGDGIAFENDIALNAWLKTYKGIVFKGNWENQTVVFHYKEIPHLISKEEWDNLDLPIDTRMCNGIIFVKVRYDDENHTVEEYRYTNDGSANWRTHKPYELNRKKDY